MQVPNIILIEDEEGDAQLVRYHLKFSGFKHHITWLKSLAMLKEHLETLDTAADICLLDLSLPDSSGLETISRCNVMMPETPIVVLTSYDDSVFLLKILETGAQNYLIKNQLTPESLLGVIRLES